MAKNMTRKGLAAGAGFALLATGLVAAPAQADATSFEISPLMGSTNNAVLGAPFQMKIKHVGGADDDVVSVFLEGALDTNITAKTDEDGHAAEYTTVQDQITDNVNVTEVDDDDKTAILQETNLDLQAGKYTIFSIDLDDTEITETTTIKLTPFLDNVLIDDKIGSQEVSGNTLEVTFHKASEVTATVDKLTPAPVGEDDAGVDSTALVTLDKNINMIDSPTAVGKVAFKENGGTAVNVTDPSYSIADEAYKATVASNNDDAGGPFVDGDVLSAQAFVEGESTGGPVVLSSVTAGNVKTMTALDVSPSNSYLPEDDSDGTNTDDVLREGSGTIELVSEVTATESTSVSVEGQPVEFKIEETSDGSIGDASITAGGETLTDSSSSADDIKVTVLTDSSGKATLELNYSNLDNTEKFKVSAEGVGDDVVDGGSETFTAVKSLMTQTTEGGTLVSTVDGGDGTDAAAYQMVKGGSGSVTFFIRDQFAQIPEGTFRAKASVNDGGDNNMEDINQTIAFSGGQATLNWTDNNDDANDNVRIDMDLEIVNPAGDYVDVDANGAYEGVDGSPETYTSVLVHVLDSAASPSRVTVNNSATGNEDINKQAYVTGDERWEQDSKAWNADPTANLTGVVYSATGGALSGASVTVSSPGVLFTNAARTVYSEDSITVTADRGGAYKVFYDSNTIGEKTFTVTSGSASETTKTTFAGVDEEDAVAISIDAPANAEPGSTIKAVATVTDLFGNPVVVDNTGALADERVRFTYDGPGLIVGDEPVASDSDGEMTISVLLGSNDTGTGTFTATHDEDGDGVLTEVLDDTSESDANNIVVSESFTVGATEVEYGTQKAWTVNQDDGTAKVYVKFPEIDGKLRILHQTGGSGSYDSIYADTTTSETMDGLRIVEGVGTYVVRTIDLADGTNRIRVSVDGEDIEVNGKDRPARYNE